MIEITQKSATPAPGMGRRLASMTYELLLVAAVLFVATFVYLMFRDPRAPGGLIFFQIYLLLIMAGYFLWFWLHGGQTLAMKTWRLRLVAADGGSVSYRQALIRFAAAFIGIPLFWWVWLDPDGQFLHDRLAGTRLIKTS
jgi:uncharacterized RDD family membrane protein YckC